MTTSELGALGRWLKLSAVCRDAGLKPNTIAQKIKRDSPLTHEESVAIDFAIWRIRDKLTEATG